MVALTDELTGFDPGVAAYTLNSLMIEGHLIYPFSLAAKPLDDACVRQAIVYGTDRTTIANTLLGEYGTLMSGTFTSKWFGYNPAVAPYPHDPERHWLPVYAQAGLFARRSNVAWERQPTHGSLAMHLFTLGSEAALRLC